MKICVVGGTGNISSAFVPLLLERGHEVVCVNRGTTGRPPDGVRLIRGDRQDRAWFEAAVARERFDAAIDMICYNAADAASSIRAFRGVGHFIHCSTVCTYGIRYDTLPADEDHPLRPVTEYGRNKAAADALYLEAHRTEGFPVTIVKPSTTYGPRMGLLRQIAWEFSWIDRVRKGRPIIVCGDGNAIHQFLHVDDAALCFANLPGCAAAIGRVYNMTGRGFTTWADYHRAAMRVLGRESELVPIPFENLRRMNIPGFSICETIFAHHVCYSPERLFADLPAFRPRVTLEEGMQRVVAAMDEAGRVPESEAGGWEDRIVAAWRRGTDGISA